MQILRQAVICLILPLGLCSLAAVGGCGASQAEVKTMVPKAADMPEGGNWRGVYFHPLYGYLHVVPAGDGIQGKWRRTNGSAWGELHGTVQGNLLRYEWTEHKVGLVGPAATSQGKGFFVYKRPSTEDNAQDWIDGEWGLNEEETGNPWRCQKQVRMEPDLKSISGESETSGPQNWKQ